MLSLTDVLPAACAALGMQVDLEQPNPIPASSTVVVFLVDGMGYHNLIAADSQRLSTGLLTSAAAGTCTFPSTTPVSLASLGTGLQPGMHGFVGATFLLPEFDTFLQPLHWNAEPDPVAVQPEPTWFEQADAAGIDVLRLGPAAYAQSGLTRAALRGGVHRGCDSLQELADAVTSLPRDGRPRLVYAYHPTLDRLGHVHGVDSDEWRNELAAVLSTIDTMRAGSAADTTLLITADHGMIDVENRVWIEDQPRLMRNVRFITGEPRMRHVFAKPGTESRLLSDWLALEAHATILTRDEFIEERLVGPVDSFVEERIGDVVAIAHDRTILAARTVDERVSNLRGHHGSNTDTEMSIPMAVLAG